MRRENRRGESHAGERSRDGGGSPTAQKANGRDIVRKLHSTLVLAIPAPPAQLGGPRSTPARNVELGRSRACGNGVSDFRQAARTRTLSTSQSRDLRLTPERGSDVGSGPSCCYRRPWPAPGCETDVQRPEKSGSASTCPGGLDPRESRPGLWWPRAARLRLHVSRVLRARSVITCTSGWRAKPGKGERRATGTKTEKQGRRLRRSS